MASAEGEGGRVACVDLFCGVGGLTHGLEREGIPVVAGMDVDPACQHPYEANNDSRFIRRDICEVEPEELHALFGASTIRVLAGCAPCQPFSTYAQRYELDAKDGRWGLLHQFTRLVETTTPEIVTMENVPSVRRHSVFQEFVDTLRSLGYDPWYDVVDSAQYGVPQSRKRMVLLASRLGDIKLIAPTHTKPKTVRQAIGGLHAIHAGETSPKDKLHAAATLSDINLQRIQASRPGGSWRDWPEDLVATCHKANTGRTYPSVYGRMEWDKPAPTMTTQCYGFGNGRFGHPEQHRAISLREAAILQGFPHDYAFVPARERVRFKTIGRLIGNAVPVDLARAIGRSIAHHLCIVEN